MRGGCFEDLYAQQFREGSDRWICAIKRDPETISEIHGPRPCEVHPNGNLIAAGWTESSLDGYTNAGSSDALLMSFDSTGTWQWTVQRGGSGEDHINHLQVHPNGNLIAAGYTDSSLDGNTNAGSYDALVMSFNSTGAWQWTVQRGGSGNDNFQSLQVDWNGNLIAAGYTDSSLDGNTNAGSNDAFLMSFDSTGTWQWTVQRGSGDDGFYGLQVDPNNNLIAAGYTDSSLDGYTNAGSSDALLVSFEACEVVTVPGRLFFVDVLVRGCVYQALADLEQRDQNEFHKIHRHLGCTWQTAL
ncbi:flaEY [Symbiodinium sp. CCMP2592]|nr:flaEY [Symbiodinium sp. CCMP2592]